MAIAVLSPQRVTYNESLLNDYNACQVGEFMLLKKQKGKTREKNPLKGRISAWALIHGHTETEEGALFTFVVANQDVGLCI